MKVFYIILLVGLLTGCTAETQVAETRATSQISKSQVSPEETFDYVIPEGTSIEVLQEGKVREEKDSYMIVFGQADGAERLVVTILPAVESSLDWGAQAQQWEEGFLKNMSRKLVSAPAEFCGQQAQHTVAEADAGGTKIRIDTCFFTFGRWNYTVSMTAPSSTMEPNPGLIETRDSIRLKPR